MTEWIDLLTTMGVDYAIGEILEKVMTTIWRKATKKTAKAAVKTAVKTAVETTVKTAVKTAVKEVVGQGAKSGVKSAARVALKKSAKKALTKAWKLRPSPLLLVDAVGMAIDVIDANGCSRYQDSLTDRALSSQVTPLSLFNQARDAFVGPLNMPPELFSPAEIFPNEWEDAVFETMLLYIEEQMKETLKDTFEYLENLDLKYSKQQELNEMLEDWLSAESDFTKTIALKCKSMIEAAQVKMNTTPKKRDEEILQNFTDVLKVYTLWPSNYSYFEYTNECWLGPDTDICSKQHTIPPYTKKPQTWVKEHVTLVTSMSSGERVGIALNKQGADWWNDSNKEAWKNEYEHDLHFAHNVYMNNNIAVHTSTYQITTTDSDGNAQVKTETLETPVTFKYAAAPLVAACEGKHQGKCINKGCVIDPTEYGVNFDFQTMNCNFTQKFCTAATCNLRHFDNGDCRKDMLSKIVETVCPSENVCANAIGTAAEAKDRIENMANTCAAHPEKPQECANELAGLVQLGLTFANDPLGTNVDDNTEAWVASGDPKHRALGLLARADKTGLTFAAFNAFGWGPSEDDVCPHFDSTGGSSSPIWKRVYNKKEEKCYLGQPGHKCHVNDDCVMFTNANGQETNKRVCKMEGGEGYCTNGIIGKNGEPAACDASHDCALHYTCEEDLQGTMKCDNSAWVRWLNEEQQRAEIEAAAAAKAAAAAAAENEQIRLEAANRIARLNELKRKQAEANGKAEKERAEIAAELARREHMYCNRACSECKKGSPQACSIIRTGRCTESCNHHHCDATFEAMPWCEALGPWNSFSGCCAAKNGSCVGGIEHKHQKIPGWKICEGTG